MNIKISIIGKSNIGKSTLFNKLTNKKSLISDIPGITRDRIYGKYKYNDFIYFIDTASIIDNPNKLLSNNIFLQTKIAIEESNIIFFMVEINKIENVDYKILKKIIFYNKNIILIVNKIDIKKNIINFLSLKIDKIYYISAKYNIGIKKLFKYLNSLKKIYKINLNKNNIKYKYKLNKININILLLGKSNVGKSTLINKLINNKNRLLVSNYSGTTIEGTSVTLEKYNLKFNITDTSGFDKNIDIGINNYKSNLNKITSNKIIDSDFIIFMTDIDIFKKELLIINYFNKIGKIVIILINKIDLLSNKKLNLYKKYIYNRFLSIKYIKMFYISVLFDIDNNNIIEYIYKIYTNLNKKFKTKLINKILNEAINNFNPYNNLKLFKPKLKYGYIISENPFKLIIHGNNIFNIKNSYKKYLENFFRKRLKIYNIPIIIILKN